VTLITAHTLFPHSPPASYLLGKQHSPTEYGATVNLMRAWRVRARRGMWLLLPVSVYSTCRETAAPGKTRRDWRGDNAASYGTINAGSSYRAAGANSALAGSRIFCVTLAPAPKQPRDGQTLSRRTSRAPAVKQHRFLQAMVDILDIVRTARCAVLIAAGYKPGRASPRSRRGYLDILHTINLILV